MSDHTPGPWRVAVRPPGEWAGRATSVYADHGDHGEVDVCSVPEWPGAVDEQNANARLIASAPTLHADLDEALALLREAPRPVIGGPTYRDWIARADALLAKHTPTERDR